MFTLALIGLVGGLITGVSPCVLPMLPIIFFAGGAGEGAAVAAPSAEEAFRKTAVATPAGGTTSIEVLGPPAAAPAKKPRIDRRPLVIIAGLVTSFSVFTLLGSALLSVLGLPDDLLRWIGLVVLAVVGLGLIYEPLGHLIEKPFYRLPKVSGGQGGAFALGLGLGTLYVPCAGPVLAAITVAGATGQIGWRTVVLTISFAIGAALPLLVFAQAGSNIRARIGAYRARARTFRIVGGVVMLGLSLALAFNLTDVLQRAVPAYTGGIEKKLAESDTVQGALTPFDTAENKDLAKCTPGSAKLASCGAAPAIRGTQQWFNTPGGSPVSLASLHGKVVLLDFWAYSCINCQRDEPHIAAWYAAYRDAGLQVIGIHAPEFAFEKSAGNLRSAIDKEHITYPVVQDNELKTWTAYRNRYWPAKYLIDETGTVRAIKFGEGDYVRTETHLRALLREANPGVALPKPVESGTTDQPDVVAGRTPEIYLSAYQSAGYAGTPMIGKTITGYQLNGAQPASTFSYGGTWRPEDGYFVSTGSSQIRLHYRARNVYHVLAGSGTVTISQAGKPDRTILVSGTPNAYPIVTDDSSEDGVLTLTYSKGVRAFTFSFG